MIESITAPIPTDMIIATASPSPTLLPSVTTAPIAPVVNIVQNPVLLHGFDIRQLIGLSGLTFIEALVSYLQDEWKIPLHGLIPAILSLVLGIILNVGIALYLHTDLVAALGIGAITGVLASGYHEWQKPNTVIKTL